MSEKNEFNAEFEAHRLDPNRSDKLAGTIKVTTDGDLLGQGGARSVNLTRSSAPPTTDQALWVAIRNRTQAIGFDRYRAFIDRVLCDPPTEDRPPDPRERALARRLDGQVGRHAYGVGAYNLLKAATEAFLLLECGVAVSAGPDLDRPLYSGADEAGRLDGSPTLAEIQDRLRQYLGGGTSLPYLQRIIDSLGNDVRFDVREGRDKDDVRAAFCTESVLMRGSAPCLIELIWSYWHEEGMLVQTLGAIGLRFQNKRGPGDRDPLAHLEIDPLRPLNNLLWGYLQDEINRLTVVRRVYEYDHHYGLTLYGKAVPPLRPADSRSKFLEGLHDLLYRAAQFYRDEADTTVVADVYPLLQSLRELHLTLAYGAHNQFGDLPWTARSEMLLQQYLLARPELREFLGRRVMVPYTEDWMGSVDVMKSIQGWTDTTVMHFRDLGVFGEQLLLSVRYGNWVAVTNEEQARNWARYWRPEVQGYVHAYRAATGVDLSAEVTEARDAAARNELPSVHLRNRLASRRPAALPGANGHPALPAGRPPARSEVPRN
jgi:hypothetical protein